MFAPACLSCVLSCAPAAFAPTQSPEASPQPDPHVVQLERRVAQLEAMLDDRVRAQRFEQELDHLIADTLADAERRMSLLDEGLLAGIDERGTIFLGSADGQSRLDIKGQVQFRYLWNYQDGRDGSASDENASGFDTRRAKLKLFGRLPGGWSYKMIFATLRTSGPGVVPDTYTEMAQIGYRIDDNWSVLAGYFKLPFSRQELISSSMQVAVDRGVTHEFFTLNFAEQVQLVYHGESLRGYLALSDGANSAISGIPNATSRDFAVTGRAEARLRGDWSAGKNEFAGDTEGLFLAAAVHYEQYDGNFLRNGVLADDTLAWTGEVLWKTPGLAISAAVFGSHVGVVGGGGVDAYGAMLQADYLLTEDVDIFARYEVLDDGGSVDSNLLDDDTSLTQAITLGFNKKLSSNIRLTSDVVYLFAGNDPVAAGRTNGGAVSSGIGLQRGVTDDDGQIAWRTQLQLLF